jgi:muramoyltetrapeptide carboxypeptidase LdcA involved in peptidoglycan recycling
MDTPDIYRTFWQMRECGWFRYCNGIIIGRPDSCKDKHDFVFADALSQGLGELNVPVLYDADIGHMPSTIKSSCFYRLISRKPIWSGEKVERRLSSRISEGA